MDIMAATVLLECIFGDVVLKSVWSQLGSSCKKMSERLCHSLTTCLS